MENQELIDKVIEQIKKDISNVDYTPLEELLKNVDTKLLQGFLSEVD